jgi:CRP-like cAMP-binding protein
MTTFVSSQSVGESFSDSSICVTSRARGGKIDVTLPAALTCPTGNFLLAALPKWQQRKLLADLELVRLPSGKVLAEPGEPQAHAYLPTTSLISLVTPIERRGAEEVAVTGSEGMIGVSLLLEGAGARGPQRRAVVEGSGYAYRLRAETLVGEFNRGGEMRQLLLHYTQALITQIAQTAVCNRHHRLAQQLCRWLLLRLDRSSGDALKVTQERIAKLLGVRRESVTEAARDLQRSGIIRYRRGFIAVLDRSELERRACECYAVVAREYARLSSYGRPHDLSRIASQAR